MFQATERKGGNPRKKKKRRTVPKQGKNGLLILGSRKNRAGQREESTLESATEGRRHVKKRSNLSSKEEREVQQESKACRQKRKRFYAERVESARRALCPEGEGGFARKKNVRKPRPLSSNPPRGQTWRRQRRETGVHRKSACSSGIKKKDVSVLFAARSAQRNTSACFSWVWGGGRGFVHARRRGGRRENKGGGKRR